MHNRTKKNPASQSKSRRVWIAKSNYLVKGGREKYRGMGPDPQTQISDGTYSISLCRLNPRKLTRNQAIEAGRKKSIWKEWGDKSGGQVWDMAHGMKKGDVVILETDGRHVHAVGIVNGSYRYDESAFAKGCDHRGAHAISVNWEAFEANDLLGGGKGDTLCLKLCNTERRSRIAQRVLNAFESESQMEYNWRIVGKERSEWVPDPGYMEGGKVIKTHISRERSSPAARSAKKAAVIKHKGRVPCSCCGIVTHDTYGSDITEAHHVIPLRMRQKSTQTKNGHFEMVCPNCHRAVHRHLDKNPLDFEGAINAVASLIKKNK